MNTHRVIHFHTAEGGNTVDTDQGCTLCRGDCPVPAACHRHDEADAIAQQRRTEKAIAAWFAAVVACSALAAAISQLEVLR